MAVTSDSQSPTSEQAELLALAVHEFRTPVTVVAGYLRMLAREQVGPLSERQLKLVQDAERSCARLGALVSEMSDLANLDGGAAELARDEVPLDEVVDEVAAAAEEGRDRGVTVTRRCGSEPLHVAGERRRIRDAVAHFVTAVLREQSEAGPVVLATERRVVEGRPMAALTIAREDTADARLTEPGPSARLNEFRGGLGLALPIARRVVEHLGGQVWSTGTGRVLGGIAVLLPLKENHA
jgi:signal transduction histidine kinase